MLRAGLVFLAGLHGAAWAQAPSAEKVFEKLAPSVWYVWGIDAGDRRVSQGSGVVVGPGKVVTNCHVLSKVRSIYVQRENVIYIARLEHADAERDLCQLDIKNFTAPAVVLGTTRDLRVGQKVYALGNPQGLEGTFSEGIVSALRGPDGKDPLIQTTAPFTSGSSGGGLFDSEGRLVGITTFIHRGSGNLNFAVPVDWVREVDERIKAAEERKRQFAAARAAGGGAAAAKALPGMPSPGMRWKYSYVDRAFGTRNATVTVRVSSTDGPLVNDSALLDGDSQGARAAATIATDEPRFVERSLGDGIVLSEFSPYLLAQADYERAQWTAIAGVAGGSRGPWRVSGRAVGWETVSVKAGTFRALKVEIIGERDADLNMNPRMATYEGKEFRYQAWYAEETRRPVKAMRRMISDSNMVIVNETLELLEYAER